MQNRDKLGILNKITAIYNPYQSNEISCYLGFLICPVLKGTSDQKDGKINEELKPEWFTRELKSQAWKYVVYSV